MLILDTHQLITYSDNPQSPFQTHSVLPLKELAINSIKTKIHLNHNF